MKGSQLYRALHACVGTELQEAASAAFAALLERDRDLAATAERLGVPIRQVHRLLDAYDLEVARPKAALQLPSGYAQHPEARWCSCAWCVWRREVRKEPA